MASRCGGVETPKAMDSDDDVTLSLPVVAQNDTPERSRRRRKTWSKPWLLRRPQHGAYETLLSELRSEDDGRGVRNFLRMETPQFEEICRKVGPCIDRTNTNMRRCISATERVAITLLHSFSFIMNSYAMVLIMR